MTHEEAVARCWAEIDLDALADNYRNASILLGNSTADIICVLKANGYGEDASIVCGVLRDAGATRFAVASGDEAELMLRDHPGIDLLILGMVGYEQAKRLAEKDAVFTLYSYEYGLRLLSVAAAVGHPVRVQLKADTGLYRIGFSGPDAPDDILKLHNSGMLRIEGLFTHIAYHNRETDRRQFETLDALVSALSAKGLDIPYVHALDSIGLTRYPERFMSAVRLGAWLYGNSPTGYDNTKGLCRPTCSIKARVTQIHTVAAGEMVGYDDDHVLARESRIATLSAGYIDGIPRYDNVGEVVIRGHRVPVFGLACMDQMMVDATDFPDIEPGDVVTFLGDGISLREYAAWGHLNRNECMCRIGRRVTRVYTYKGKETYLNDTQRILEGE